MARRTAVSSHDRSARRLADDDPGTEPYGGGAAPGRSPPILARAPKGGVQHVVVEDLRVTYTVDEVAAIVGISRSAVYDSIARGEIPAKRLGRRIVVVKLALEEFLADYDGARHPPTDGNRRRGRPGS